jgi:hypothetical protein
MAYDDNTSRGRSVASIQRTCGVRPTGFAVRPCPVFPKEPLRGWPLITILLYESGPAVKLGTLFWFGPGASRTLG